MARDRLHRHRRRHRLPRRHRSRRPRPPFPRRRRPRPPLPPRRPRRLPTPTPTPTPTGGSTAWIETRPDQVLGAGAELSGPITLLDINSNGDAAIERFDAEGKLQWSQADSHDLYGLHQEPVAGRIIVGEALPPASQPTQNSLYELAEDGTGEHLIDRVNGPDHSSALLASDRQDDKVIFHSVPEQIDIDVRSGDGSTQWSVLQKDHPGLAIEGAAFDDERNVILVGGAGQSDSIQGHALEPGLVILKFSLGGELQWIQNIPTSGLLWTVGTSGKGTVVAAGTASASGTWGSSSFAAGTVLVTVEANGKPRWVRQIQGSVGYRLQLVVDPPGQVAVAFASQCRGMTVQRFNLAGDFLWSRAFEPDVCSDNTTVFGWIALSNHAVVVGGNYSGTVDFGSGAVKNSGKDGPGFLLELAP